MKKSSASIFTAAVSLLFASACSVAHGPSAAGVVAAPYAAIDGNSVLQPNGARVIKLTQTDARTTLPNGVSYFEALPFRGNAGDTYRAVATSPCNCYAPQPQVVLPVMQVFSVDGTKLGETTGNSRSVGSNGPGGFALENDVTFQVPSDGKAVIVVAADNRYTGQSIASLKETITRPVIYGGGTGSGVQTSKDVTNATNVKSSPVGDVSVRVEAPVSIRN